MAVLFDANTGKVVNTGEKMPEGKTEQGGEMTPLKALLEIKSQKMLEKELAKLDEPATPAKKEKEGEDSLAATIVKAALEANTKATERYEKLAERNDEATQKARAEADVAKAQTNAIVAQQIGGALEKLEKMQTEVKSGNTPRKLKDEIQDAVDLINVLRGSDKPAGGGGGGATGPSEQLTVTLENMRQTHEMGMKKLDAEIAKMNAELKIRMAEFDDNRETKRMEYEDSKKFRDNAFGAVTDIAAAAAEGFKSKTGEGIGTQVQPAANQPAQSEPEVMVAIKSFPCQSCGGEIAMPASGEDVICPECGVHYALKRAHGQ